MDHKQAFVGMRDVICNIQNAQGTKTHKIQEAPVNRQEKTQTPLWENGQTIRTGNLQEQKAKANDLMKGYSNSLAIGELEIETRRHHFAPIKLKRLGGLESVQCGQERTDIRMFSCYSGECSTSSSEDPTLIHPIKYTHAL